MADRESWRMPRVLTPEQRALARAEAAKFPPFTAAQKEVLRQTMHIVFEEEDS